MIKFYLILFFLSPCLIFANPLNEKLISAAYAGNIEYVKFLLNQGADLEYKDSNGFTALMWSVYNDHTKTSRLLIERFANVSTEIQDYSPILMATQNNNYELVVLLGTYGADLNTVNDHGNTALHFAAANGRKEIIEFLIGFGANPAPQNIMGMTPIDYVAQRGHYDLLNHLVESGMPVNRHKYAQRVSGIPDTTSQNATDHLYQGHLK